jgi:hypothetical protein
MRLGQAVGEIVSLLSDPEVRLAIVPLVEADYGACQEAITKIPMPDTVEAAAFKDRQLTREVLAKALREPDDFSQKAFRDSGHMSEALEIQDVGHLWDAYCELVNTSSPAAEAIPPDELDEVKKVLQEMDWNAQSGRQWYALQRYLLTIGPELLEGKLLGFGSTTKSTGQNDSDESMTIADLSLKSPTAKSAENE